MPNKEILRVEIDTSEFSEFKKKFDAYEAAVKALPGEWQKSGTEIVAQKSHFEAMADSIRSQAQELVNLASAQGKIGASLEGAGLAMIGMAKSGRQFAGSIFQATASLRHWTKLTAIFSGLIGAGGLFGLSRMALNVASQRSSAAGLGVTYGERASFLANFGRLGNAAGLLQGFSEAETDISKKYALRQYLGHGESGDPAKDFAEGLLRFKDLVDRTPKELLGPALQQRGYNKLGFDTETALAVRGTSRAEIEQISRDYGADLATRLGLPPDVARKWQEFTTRIEKAGEDIDTVLWRGTGKLTKPLEHLSEGFEHLVSALLREGSPISEWIKKLGHGISRFADDLGSGTMHTVAGALIRDAGAVVQLFDAIVTKVPRGLAVLLGAATGARLGGAAVGVGTGLARSRLLGAAAGAVVSPSAALAAGGLAASTTPLNAGEDERARQQRYHQGPSAGNRSEHFRQMRHIFGHPHVKGIHAPATAAAPAAPGTPWNHELHGGDENIPLSGGAAERRDSLSGMQPGFRSRLAAMFHDAPPGSSVFSGYRSPALQAELFRRPHRPGYVARPGHSHHGMGDAADIRGNLEWFHQNAHKYGLRFPMMDPHKRPYENWHIQSDPNTRVPIPHHALPSVSARRRSFGHPHIGHHPASISNAEHHTMIEDQTGGMVALSGDTAGHPRSKAGTLGGQDFQRLVEFYKTKKEKFQPMIGNVEDRRFDEPPGMRLTDIPLSRSHYWPTVPDATIGGHIMNKLKGPGKPLGAHHPSGLSPIEESVKKYIQDMKQREWDKIILKDKRVTVPTS